MTRSIINTDRMLERVLAVRPEATIEDVRRLIPAVSTQHDNSLRARMELIRNRLTRGGEGLRIPKTR